MRRVARGCRPEHPCAFPMRRRPMDARGSTQRPRHAHAQLEHVQGTQNGSSDTSDARCPWCLPLVPLLPLLATSPRAAPSLTVPPHIPFPWRTCLSNAIGLSQHVTTQTSIGPSRIPFRIPPSTSCLGSPSCFSFVPSRLLHRSQQCSKTRTSSTACIRRLPSLSGVRCVTTME